MLVLIVYTLLYPITWIGMGLALLAGVAQLGRLHMLLCLLGLFGACVFQTYQEGGSNLTPWPYIMGAIAVVMAILAHIIGLGLSRIIPSNRRDESGLDRR